MKRCLTAAEGIPYKMKDVLIQYQTPFRAQGAETFSRIGCALNTDKKSQINIGQNGVSTEIRTLKRKVRKVWRGEEG